MSEWSRLVHDPRTWEAVDDLLRQDAAHGYVPKESIFSMLQEIAALPGAWDACNKEHPSDAKKRRAKLAAQVRTLAVDIEADPEARHLRIINSQEVTTSLAKLKGIECRTVSEFLSDLADAVADHHSYADEFAALRGDKTTRDAKHEYVYRAVVLCVKRYIVGCRRGQRKGGADTLPGEVRDHDTPSKACTLLVNAVLGLHGDQALRNDRKKINRVWDSSD